MVSGSHKRNKFRDNGAALLVALVSVSSLILVVTISLFIAKFHHLPLSDNPADWYSFIPIVVGVINLVITGIIAWQVQTINKKNSRRNSVLPFLAEIYIDFDSAINEHIGKIAEALTDYNFYHIDVELLMDAFENRLLKLRPRFIAFFNDDTLDSFSILLNSVREFNTNLRQERLKHVQLSDEDLFRIPEIIQLYIQVDRRAKRTKKLMHAYMND